MKLFRTSNKTNTVLERNKTLVKGMNLAERQVLDRSQIELGPLLGQGGFAKVSSCTLDGQKAVVKVIPSDKLNDEMIYLLNNEVAVWCNLVHRNITTFYGMAYTEKAIWLVCEFMKDGSLMDHHEKMRKQKAPPPDMPTLLGQIHQISSGMEYLHSLKSPVLHRDLKSANILLAEGGARLAIADFGLARIQANVGVKMTAETGSYRWMAPEVIKHEEYNWRCDVYSYGIMVWEMMTYQIPFNNMMPVEAAFAVAKSEARPPKPAHVQEEDFIWQFLLEVWHQTAERRPSFAQINEQLDSQIAKAG